MKKHVFGGELLLCIALIFGCANGSSDSLLSLLPATETKSEESTPKADENTEAVVIGTKSEGSVSKDAVSTNGLGQTVATISDSNGGVYEFTADGSGATQSARTAITTSGSWVYKVNLVIKWSGTYSGDISKIGTESFELNMVIEKTTNSIDEAVKVVEKKTFSIKFTETAFSTTIPQVVSGVLDLRIKGGTVANTDNVYDPSKSFEKGVVSGTPVRTAHVVATPYTNGIDFEITCPSDAVYGGQFGYVAVHEQDASDTKLTRMEFNSNTSKVRGFWPFCTKGQKMKFVIQMEPPESHLHRDKIIWETVELTANGGIGKIDYTNLNAKKWLTYGWDIANDRPTIEFDPTELELPNVTNLRTVVNFFAGTDEWGNNTTIWASGVSRNGANYKIILSHSEVSELKTKVRLKGKNQFIYEYSFYYEIPECSGVTFSTYKFWTKPINLP